MHNNLARAQYLVERGVDVNAINYQYKGTSLHVASRNGHLAMMRYLIDVGHADVNAINASW
jgi:ankyrin repeat protein